MTTKLHIAAALALFLFAAGARDARAYGWPVKPFAAPHPVRGSFGDPRTVFFGPPSARTLASGGGKFQFHFGVDISAANGTAVYPVASGVVTRVTAEEIDVASSGRRFEYWHLDAAVRPGDHVTARQTVLGRIARPSGHVHLSELVDGAFVNPLQAGHLEPYADTTRPRVASLTVRRSGGRTELVAAAEDLPSLAVPGAWSGLPVTPAQLTWRLETTNGRVVVPTTVVYDVRRQLPRSDTFWQVYARGTHQNMTAFHKFYAYRQPGAYLFRLTPNGLRAAAGAYRVVVTARDIAGNTGTLTQRIEVGS